MSHSFTQTLTDLFLPSLQAMGVWAYWIIGAASALEAFFLTGVVLPGSILVDLGGVLVHRGFLDFVDLLWFVAVGSWIGSYGSFWFGRRLAAGQTGRKWVDPSGSAAFRKALALFERHGPAAVLLGRFSGPVAGLVPFAAGLSGMPRRKFLLYSAIGAVPYAIVHVAIGYGASEVFGRLSPALTREAVALALILLVIGLLWYVVARIIRLLPWVLSVLFAALRGIAAEPKVATWLSRHPLLVAGFSARLARDGFRGLPMTLTLGTLAVLGTLYAGSVIDYLSGDPIVRADRNIASLLHSLQSPFGLRVAAHVTAFGDWRAAASILAAVCIVFWVRGQTAIVAGALIATLGQTVTVSVLKHLFGRARPAVAHFTETSASFPSGHASLSVALFGFVGYAVWRSGLVRASVAAPMTGLAILSVGFSRLYLGEHYLSDVVNGFLVGAIWLVIGIAVTEALRMGSLPPTAPRRAALLGASLPFFIIAAFVVARYDKPVAPATPALAAITLAEPADVLRQSGFDPYAESLIGTRVEPVSILLVAPDSASVIAAFEKAGWNRPAPADLPQLMQAALAAWTNRPDSVAPITPYFREGRPNDLAFQRPDPSDSLRRRHHLRLWQTQYRLRDGAVLFLATASFDDGLKWGLVHHISPNLDAERDLILRELSGAGVLKVVGEAAESGPLSGKDEFGDPWFSDGRVIFAEVNGGG